SRVAARRIERMCGWLPGRPRAAIANLTERWVRKRVLWFYGLARATLAPNTELQQMLNIHSVRPSFLMRRGIDTQLLSPARRDRESGPFTLGFVEPARALKESLPPCAGGAGPARRRRAPLSPPRGPA